MVPPTISEIVKRTWQYTDQRALARTLLRLVAKAAIRIAPDCTGAVDIEMKRSQDLS